MIFRMFLINGNGGGGDVLLKILESLGKCIWEFKKIKYEVNN